MRWKNRDALKRVKGKKVVVARDEMAGIAAYREFEEFVIPGIPAGRNAHIGINPFCLARQGRDETSDVFFFDIPPEALSTEHFVQFGEHRKGKQNLA